MYGKNRDHQIRAGLARQIQRRRHAQGGAARQPPFQVIETVNESRATREAKKGGLQGALFDVYEGKEGDTFEAGWKNKLIWGDNLLVMGSLLEKFAGKVDLIYIDPPFATGADFSFTTQVGEDNLDVTKEQSIIEEKAYRDTWGSGGGSYLLMLSDRLRLIRNLLSVRGSLYVHLDWHYVHAVRHVLDEISGTDNFVNEIVRVKSNPKNFEQPQYGNYHDTILFYAVTRDVKIWHPPRQTLSEKQKTRDFPLVEAKTGRRYKTDPIHAPGIRYGITGESWRGIKPPPGRHWAHVPETLDDFDAAGRIEWSSTGNPRLKTYADENDGYPYQDIWTEFKDPVRKDYATEKSEGLIQLIVEASSDPESLVADFFCGSGTTLAVAEKLGRRWIGCDLGRWGIHVTRKRLLGIESCKPFEVWLVEIAGQRDAKALIEACATIFQQDLLSKNIEFQTTMDGRRQVRRYVPEMDTEGVQDLPPENLRRYALKMATGSGKTWVIAMAIIWARFHKQRATDSPLSTNFLIVAPNVIVYQRLERDFAANRIFYELPLIPPEWRGAFSQKVILRGEAAEPDPSGNLFLTNIHQLYESRDEEWTPQNAIEALLGKKPAKDLAASGQRSMLERVKSLKDLVVINDEAHHVHDDDLAWNQSLMAIHRELPNGIALWLDFSATPKDQNGMYFPWTVCDYPLAQAVEDRIVKAPLIVTKEDDPKQPADDPDGVTKENIGEKHGYWLRAAVRRWKEHHKVFKQLGRKPVLFVMAEKNVYADAIGEYLCKTREFGFKESEVLVIHTDTAGEITKKDLDIAREAARDIDKAESKIKAICLDWSFKRA